MEGCRWDAILVSESWSASNAEIWESQQGHMFMGSGKVENKHGIGILVNKKWRKHINWTDYISERAITTSITVNKQHVLLMIVYFTHSGYADHHVEKVYRSIEKLTKSKKQNMNWDQGLVLNVSVLDRTHSKWETREENG